MELVCLFFSSLTSLGFKEDDTGEQSCIGCWHLLTGQDNAAIDTCAFPMLSISTAFRASGIIIDSFEKVYMFVAEGVFIFVKMNDHITDLGTLFAHSVVCCALQIAHLWIALKQADDTDGKFRLSGAFFAVDIQQWE